MAGKGDGKRVEWETPFPAKEARGLHVMRNFVVIGERQINRVLGVDGELLREEADGYDVTVTSPDAPVKVTFQRPVPPGHFVGFSALGRKPEGGEAIKVLPMTDPIAKALDEKVPPELRKRKREEVAQLGPMQDMYREAWAKLAIDGHGFTDESDEPLAFDDINKRAILSTLGAIYLGGFVIDRANVLQQERQAGRKTELTD